MEFGLFSPATWAAGTPARRKVTRRSRSSRRRPPPTAASAVDETVGRDASSAHETKTPSVQRADADVKRAPPIRSATSAALGLHSFCQEQTRRSASGGKLPGRYAAASRSFAPEELLTLLQQCAGAALTPSSGARTSAVEVLLIPGDEWQECDPCLVATLYGGRATSALHRLMANPRCTSVHLYAFAAHVAAYCPRLSAGVALVRYARGSSCDPERALQRGSDPPLTRPPPSLALLCSSPPAAKACEGRANIARAPLALYCAVRSAPCVERARQQCSGAGGDAPCTRRAVARSPPSRGPEIPAVARSCPRGVRRGVRPRRARGEALLRPAAQRARGEREWRGGRWRRRVPPPLIRTLRRNGRVQQVRSSFLLFASHFFCLLTSFVASRVCSSVATLGLLGVYDERRAERVIASVVDAVGEHCSRSWERFNPTMENGADALGGAWSAEWVRRTRRSARERLAMKQGAAACTCTRCGASRSRGYVRPPPPPLARSLVLLRTR